MSNHKQIKTALNMDIYFCDPHSPWQRGSNENTNGLLRQYFPKGTDLSGYHPDYLDYVANQLNDRPRKRLKWLNPHQSLPRATLKISKIHPVVRRPVELTYCPSLDKPHYKSRTKRSPLAREQQVIMRLPASRSLLLRTTSR